MKRLALFVILCALFFAASVAVAECNHKYTEWRLEEEGNDHTPSLYSRRCTKCGQQKYQSQNPQGTLYQNITNHDDEVNALKDKLRAMGFTVDVKGYGQETYKAVRTVQQKYGFKRTGIAYPQTLAAIDKLYTLSLNKRNNGEYLLLRQGDAYYTVVGENRLIINYEYNFKPDKMKKCIELYNTAFDKLKVVHPEVSTYLYYVESSRTLDLGLRYDSETDSYILSQDINPISPSYSIIMDQLHMDTIAHLEVNSTDSLFEYFYSTDHHWNYRGSYRAYTEIVRMMLGEDEPLTVPVEEHEFPFVFNGSAAKGCQMPISKERFKVYIFDRMPDYISYINDKKRAYNSSKQYLNGKYDTSIYTDHYGMYYGGNYAKVLFENPEAPDRTLLIVGVSFANPIKTMLTAHYRNIVFIDPRHYENTYHKKFSLLHAVQQYGINDVLMLFDVCALNIPENIIVP